MKGRFMKRKLVIIGTGLFPEVARCYFDEFSDYEVVAFACHEEFKAADKVYGLPLLSIESLHQFHPPDQADVFVGIGYQKMNRTRERVFYEMKKKNYNLASFCHPNVHRWSNSKFGENTFIFEDNTIQPFVEIGDNTILWSGNHIGHHSKIGNHCFISSHVVLSGSCKVGNNVFMGVNATLHDSITIGDYSLIAAGAIVSKNTPKKGVYAPAATKLFAKNSEEIGF